MTREEAIEYAESKKMRLEALVYNDDCKYGNYAMYSGELSFVNAALSALRPVSREQVEKVWRGEWIISPNKEINWDGEWYQCKCSKCGNTILTNSITKLPLFCMECYTAMMDEAVEMVMERMEALHGQETE